jgi:hypothetical protein
MFPYFTIVLFILCTLVRWHARTLFLLASRETPPQRVSLPHENSWMV